MKVRLKEALDEKRDFEIEYLQLQKNYIRTKNQLAEAQKQNAGGQAAAPGEPPSKEDKDKLNKMIAAQ